MGSLFYPLISQNSCSIWWWISWLVIFFFFSAFNLLSNWIAWSLVLRFWLNSVYSTQLIRIIFFDSWGCTNLFKSTLLLLGLKNCEITTALIVDSLAPYLLSVSVTGGYLLSYLYKISAGYGTPFLMDRVYHTYLPIAKSYAVLLATYVVTRHVPSWDLDRGINVLNWCWYQPKYPEPTRAPAKLLQQTSISGQ